MPAPSLLRKASRLSASFTNLIRYVLSYNRPGQNKYSENEMLQQLPTFFFYSFKGLQVSKQSRTTEHTD
ncbi:Hypothetical predicted protein [Podarcis lilfordi]|uniref:Uncharacterized protein n=1 Tax=Podarcis lilfordi TaxID=74358 RepID=A0AA35KC70_9SAUR|nr:Hypothetical predicted protein [Podarcis lilfordi]